MTDEELREIFDACKPTLCIMIGNCEWPSPQDKVNAAWERLGKKRGFDYLTVRPVDGQGDKFFTAVPSETEVQRQERDRQEANAARDKRAVELRQEIADAEAELKKLSV
jgi:hypothetical protein